VNVDSEHYCNSRPKLLPDIQERSTCRLNRENRTLHQEGAHIHSARNTINVLHRGNITFIEPDMSPPK